MSVSWERERSMSKKIGIFMGICCVFLTTIFINKVLSSDNKGPSITFLNDDIKYVKDMNDQDLLEDVVAYDDVDGDVSDSLMIESITDLDDGNVFLVYVAKDKQNNVSKKQRYIAYEEINDEDSKNDEDDENVGEYEANE